MTQEHTELDRGTMSSDDAPLSPDRKHFIPLICRNLGINMLLFNWVFSAPKPQAITNKFMLRSIQ